MDVMKEHGMIAAPVIETYSVISKIGQFLQYIVDLALFLLIVLLSSIVVVSVAIAAPLAVGISALAGREDKLVRPNWTPAKA